LISRDHAAARAKELQQLDTLAAIARAELQRWTRERRAPRRSGGT
jgi:hypothetical protein